jgi:hypothetical protein
VRAVHQQVVLRAEGRMLDIEEFLVLRRDTGALKVCLNSHWKYFADERRRCALLWASLD